MSVEDVYQRTKIDRWFLNNIRQLVETEQELKACHTIEEAGDDLLWRAKQEGFSDRQLGFISMTTMRPSSGLMANWMLLPPVSTPISRMMRMAASRIR